MSCVEVTQSTKVPRNSDNIVSEENNKASAALALSVLSNCANGDQSNRAGNTPLNASNRRQASHVQNLNGDIGLQEIPASPKTRSNPIRDLRSGGKTDGSASPLFNPLTSSARKDLFKAKKNFNSAHDSPEDQALVNGVRNGSERKRPIDKISEEGETNNSFPDNTKHSECISSHFWENSHAHRGSLVPKTNFEASRRGPHPGFQLDTSTQQPYSQAFQHTPQHYNNNPNSFSQDMKLPPAPPPRNPYYVPYHPYSIPPHQNHYPHYINSAPPGANTHQYPFNYHYQPPQSNSYPTTSQTTKSGKNFSHPPPLNGVYSHSYYGNYSNTTQQPQHHFQNFPGQNLSHPSYQCLKENSNFARSAPESVDGINTPDLIAGGSIESSTNSGNEVNNGVVHVRMQSNTTQANINNESKNKTENNNNALHGHRKMQITPQATHCSMAPPQSSSGTPSQYYPPTANMNTYPPPHHSYNMQHTHPNPHYGYPSTPMMVTPQTHQYHHHYQQSPYYPLPPHQQSPYTPPYTLATNGNLQTRTNNGSSSTPMDIRSSALVSPRCSPGIKKVKTYSRKDKSLGLLCSNFMNRYGKEHADRPCTLPHDANFVCLEHRCSPNDSLTKVVSLQHQAGNNGISIDEAATALCVERRRIYDIINILESIQIVSRKCKNTYYWHGKCCLPLIFAKMQIQAAKMWPNDAKKNGIWVERDEFFNDAQKSEENETEQCKTLETVNNHKEKSLGKLSQEFLQLFLVGFKVISLTEATEKILGESCNIGNETTNAADVEKASSWIKTKGRRLYDIANVMASIGIIRICPNENGSGNQKNKRSFEWKYKIQPHQFRSILKGKTGEDTKKNLAGKVYVDQR